MFNTNVSWIHKKLVHLFVHSRRKDTHHLVEYKSYFSNYFKISGYQHRKECQIFYIYIVLSGQHIQEQSSRT